MDVNIYISTLYNYMKNKADNFSLGGRAIASGGFGCVFLPPLKCKGSDRPVGKVVSKLLTTKNAEKEFDEAKEIQSMLQTNLSLDTYNRYYIFPEKLCEPDALTKADLENFEQKCKSLTKRGISSDNINTNLDSVRIIELTDGGSDLSKAIKGMKTNDDLSKMNKIIIDLLVNAIVPMNRLGILHFDLKSANILMDDTSQLRIIDWGLSVISKNNTIPIGSTSRPIQYNLPFSTVLFNDKIMNDINKGLKQLYFDTNYTESIKPELSALVHQIVVEHFSKSDKGHIEYVSENIEILFNIPGKRNYFIYNLLSNYLTEAIINFINPITQTFDVTKYFNDVCMKNCDIWGLITIYNDILIHYEGLSLFKSNASDVLKQLRLFVMRYLYSPEFAGKPIDITKLVAELKLIMPFSGSIKNASTIKNASKSSESKNNSVIDLVSVSSPVKKKTRRKRCKNGTRRNKKTGECEATNKARDSNQVEPKQVEPKQVEPESSSITGSLFNSLGLFQNEDKNIPVVKKQKVVIGEKKPRKRCKNGTRRNKKTGECDDTNKKLKSSSSLDTVEMTDTVEPESVNSAIVEPANTNTTTEPTTTTVEPTKDVAEPPSLFTRLGF